jgi:5-methylcytosine-specific restriction endonuclease McrA
MTQNPHRALYSSQRWRKAARRQLRDHSLCAMHLLTGQIVPAQEADHIVRHGGNLQAFWDPKNLQSLCRACHEAKSADEEGHKRRGFSLDVDGDGYALDPAHPSNRRSP